MKQSGFTLIEVMIALAIFSLIGLASTAVLTTVIDSSNLSRERIEGMQRLQRAMIIIERDVQQAMPRPVRVNGETNNYVFFGGDLDDSDADNMVFVRGGWHNPKNMLPRSTLQLVAYRLSEGKLERLYGNFLDNVTGYEAKTLVLLDDIEDFTVEYLPNVVQGNNKKVEWQSEHLSETLPAAVAIEITSEKFGVIRREFALPGGTS